MSAIPARCRDGAPALSLAEIEAMSSELDEGWSQSGTASIERRFALEDFGAALTLVNAIGAAAEEENHHPDLSIRDYRHVTVTLSTHDAGGLSANDFVMARRSDALYRASASADAPETS